MRKLGTITVVITAFLLLAATAVAANVHFKGKGGPQFSEGGLTLTASGTLAGLGNGDILVTLTASGQPAATCTNQGGNEAPGQNPAVVDVGGQVAIPDGQIKNGTVSFSVTTSPPDQPTPQEAGCPSANWSAEITAVDFSGFQATLTVIQGGQEVLTQTFTIN